MTSQEDEFDINRVLVKLFGGLYRSFKNDGTLSERLDFAASSLHTRFQEFQNEFSEEMQKNLKLQYKSFLACYLEIAGYLKKANENDVKAEAISAAIKKHFTLSNYPEFLFKHWLIHEMTILQIAIHMQLTVNELQKSIDEEERGDPFALWGTKSRSVKESSHYEHEMFALQGVFKLIRQQIRDRGKFNTEKHYSLFFSLETFYPLFHEICSELSMGEKSSDYQRIHLSELPGFINRFYQGYFFRSNPDATAFGDYGIFNYEYKTSLRPYINSGFQRFVAEIESTPLVAKETSPNDALGLLFQKLGILQVDTPLLAQATEEKLKEVLANLTTTQRLEVITLLTNYHRIFPNGWLNTREGANHES